MYTLELDHPDLRRYTCIWTLLAIHNLADKYEVRGLQARCADEFKFVEDSFWDIFQLQEMIEKHYPVCFDKKCKLGRKICNYLLKQNSEFVRSNWCRELLEKRPKFAQDMIAEAIENNHGRLC